MHNTKGQSYKGKECHICLKEIKCFHKSINIVTKTKREMTNWGNYMWHKTNKAILSLVFLQISKKAKHYSRKVARALYHLVIATKVINNKQAQNSLA